MPFEVSIREANHSQYFRVICVCKSVFYLSLLVQDRLWVWLISSFLLVFTCIISAVQTRHTFSLKYVPHYLPQCSRFPNERYAHATITFYDALISSMARPLPNFPVANPAPSDIVKLLLKSVLHLCCPGSSLAALLGLLSSHGGYVLCTAPSQAWCLLFSTSGMVDLLPSPSPLSWES